VLIVSYFVYGLYLIHIFNKTTLPDLSLVYRIHRILPDLSCISLFSINVTNSSYRSANDTKWWDSFDSDRYTYHEARGRIFQKSINVTVGYLKVGSDSFNHYWRTLSELIRHTPLNTVFERNLIFDLWDLTVLLTILLRAQSFELVGLKRIQRLRTRQCFISSSQKIYKL